MAAEAPEEAFVLIVLKSLIVSCLPFQVLFSVAVTTLLAVPSFSKSALNLFVDVISVCSPEKSADITASAIFIVEPSTLTPPFVVVEAVGKVYDVPEAEITPLFIVIVDPSTITTPASVVLAGLTHGEQYFFSPFSIAVIIIFLEVTSPAIILILVVQNS